MNIKLEYYLYVWSWFLKRRFPSKCQSNSWLITLHRNCCHVRFSSDHMGVISHFFIGPELHIARLLSLWVMQSCDMFKLLKRRDWSWILFIFLGCRFPTCCWSNRFLYSFACILSKLARFSILCHLCVKWRRSEFCFLIIPLVCDIIFIFLKCQIFFLLWRFHNFLYINRFSLSVIQSISIFLNNDFHPIIKMGFVFNYGNNW